MSTKIEELKRQLLVGQFVMVAGCSAETALEMLVTSHWQLEAALSIFFQEATSHHHHHAMVCAPSNTPATPPNFPEALTMFSRLQASDSGGGAEVASPTPGGAQHWAASPTTSQVPVVAAPPRQTWPPVSSSHHAAVPFCAGRGGQQMT
ncbi:UBA-like domain-containing protein 2 [Lampetra fluviatilis]